jgi:5'-deoxynucleotidase YfbR-like HD superfamily hydrolase
MIRKYWHGAVINGVKRDLNPRFNKGSYKISDEDKQIIELAAASLLFEGNTPLLQLWKNYQSSEDKTALLFRGFDKICVMWRCLDFVKSGKYEYSDFRAYWDYWSPESAAKKLPDLVSKAYIDDVWSEAEKLRPV